MRSSRTSTTTGSTSSSALQRQDRYEFVDAWGSPFVYIHSSDYTNMKGVEQYVLPGQGGTNTVKVKPLTQEKTGKFFRPNGFQLFSLGPDGQPDTGDEVHFGK